MIPTKYSLYHLQSTTNVQMLLFEAKLTFIFIQIVLTYMLSIKYSLRFSMSCSISDMSASNDFVHLFSICGPKESGSAGSGGSGNMIDYP